MMLGPTKLPDWLEDFNDPCGPTIPAALGVLPPIDHVPARPPVVLQIDCDAFQRRSFRRGLIFGMAMALVAFSVGGFLAVAAHAEVATDWVSISGTIVTLGPSDAPGAVAEVVMQNVAVNDGRDAGRYDLARPGLAVAVDFQWQVDAAGADAVTVLPPDGLVCLPADCRAVVLEGFSGTVTLYDLEGVGM